MLLLAYARYDGEDGYHPESPQVLRGGGETQGVARQRVHRRRDGAAEPDPSVTPGTHE